MILGPATIVKLRNDGVIDQVDLRTMDPAVTEPVVDTNYPGNEIIAAWPLEDKVLACSKTACYKFTVGQR